MPRFLGKVVEKAEEEATTKRLISQENAAILLLFKMFAG